MGQAWTPDFEPTRRQRGGRGHGRRGGHGHGGPWGGPWGGPMGGPPPWVAQMFGADFASGPAAAVAVVHGYDAATCARPSSTCCTPPRSR